MSTVTHLGNIQDVLWNEVFPSCFIRVRSQPHSQAPGWTDGGILLNIAVVSQHLQAHKKQNRVHAGRERGKASSSARVIKSSSSFQWHPWD